MSKKINFQNLQTTGGGEQKLANNIYIVKYYHYEERG